MTRIAGSTLDRIRAAVYQQYGSFSRALPFHGWQHIEFVTQKARALAEKNGADPSLVEAAALVHDLNYMVRRNSTAGTGTDLRRELLAACSIGAETIAEIESIVRTASVEERARVAGQGHEPAMTLEMQALSDADTLYKALPITPVLLSHRYMDETGISISELADKIVRDQRPLLEAGTYFFDTDTRHLYERWARINVELWQAIQDSLRLPEVRLVVSIVEQSG